MFTPKNDRRLLWTSNELRSSTTRIGQEESSVIEVFDLKIVSIESITKTEIVRQKSSTTQLRTFVRVLELKDEKIR